MTICTPSVANYYKGQYNSGFDYVIPAYVPGGSRTLLSNFKLLGQNYSPGRAGGTIGPVELNDAGQCYAGDAQASALQMMRERQQRRAAQNLPPFPDSIAQLFFDGFQIRHLDDFVRAIGIPTTTAQSFFDWLNHGANDSTVLSYVGDFQVSLLQFIHDDITASDSSQIFEPLKSIDGILPYPPARLAQVNLADTYHALMGTEENALALIAQSQSPATVAQISTTQTVTDPIGRLATGAFVQNQLLGGGSLLSPSLISNPGVPASVNAVTSGNAGAAGATAGAPATAPGGGMLLLLAVAVPFLLPK